MLEIINLLSPDICLAVVKDGRVKTYSGRGIKPLLTAITEEKDFFAGAAAADKTVGRAAALLFAYAGVGACYGAVMSAGAAAAAAEYGIEASYGARVDNILNADGTDICLMEKMAEGETPESAFNKFRKFFNL